MNAPVSTRTRRLMFGAAFAVLLCLPVATRADDPKFKNPAPRFTPLTWQEANAVATTKRGPEPTLTANEQKLLAAGEVVRREIRKPSAPSHFEAFYIIDGAPAEVAAFLKDYPAHVRYMPHYKSISATWYGNMAVVDMTLKVALSTVHYRMQRRHYGDALVEWEYLDGDIKDTQGFYKMWPRDEGKKTLIVFHVFTDPGLALPDFIRNSLTKNSLPDVLKAIAKGVADRKKA